MAKEFFSPFPGRGDYLRTWLGLGDERHPEDPSLHDLLDLDESCRDEGQIQSRTQAQYGKLLSLEAHIRAKEGLDTNRLLSDLLLYIAQAPAVLCDPKKRDQYGQELLGYRQNKLVALLEQQHFQPGDRVDEMQRNRLVEAGSLRFRLSKEDAERTIRDFFRRDDVPDGERDLVSWLQVAVFKEDPCWPTHFDVLGLEDGSPAEPMAVQSARTAQLGSAKLQGLLRHPDHARQERAKSVLLRVEQAARELGNPTKTRSYIAECRKQREAEFRRHCQEYRDFRGENPRARERLSLLAQAANDLRLPQSDAERVISEVFHEHQRQTPPAQVEQPAPKPVPQPAAPLPKLDVSPRRLSFGTVVRGDNQDGTLTLRNTGGGTLEARVKCRHPWAIPDRSTISVRGDQVVSIRVNTATLKRGSWWTTVYITSNGGGVRIPVDVDVTAEGHTALRWLARAFCVPIVVVVCVAAVGLLPGIMATVDLSGKPGEKEPHFGSKPGPGKTPLRPPVRPPSHPRPTPRLKPRPKPTPPPPPREEFTVARKELSLELGPWDEHDRNLQLPTLWGGVAFDRRNRRDSVEFRLQLVSGTKQQKKIQVKEANLYWQPVEGSSERFSLVGAVDVPGRVDLTLTMAESPTGHGRKGSSCTLAGWLEAPRNAPRYGSTSSGHWLMRLSGVTGDRWPTWRLYPIREEEIPPDQAMKYVRINVAEAWNRTGVEARKGQQLRFRAWGRFRSIGYEASPEGIRQTRRGSPLVDSWPFSCLIGKIGASPQQPFRIGEECDATANRSGELFLQINDAAPDTSHHQGYLNVKVYLCTSLTIESNPSGIAVTLDDRVLDGTTPLTVRVLPGPHTIRITKGGYEPVARKVVALRGEQQLVRVSLKEKPESIIKRVQHNLRLGWELLRADRAEDALGKFNCIVSEYEGAKVNRDHLLEEDEFLNCIAEARCGIAVYCVKKGATPAAMKHLERYILGDDQLQSTQACKGIKEKGAAPFLRDLTSQQRDGP